MAKRKASKTKPAKVAVKTVAKSPAKSGKKSRTAGTSAPSQNGAIGTSAVLNSADANSLPTISQPLSGRTNGEFVSATERQRFLPLGGELKSLYARYYNCSTFDDHDKAFYFVLDVGGINRARQLVAHVEEVLAELEEFQG